MQGRRNHGLSLLPRKCRLLGLSTIVAVRIAASRTILPAFQEEMKPVRLFLGIKHESFRSVSSLVMIHKLQTEKKDTKNVIFMMQ